MDLDKPPYVPEIVRLILEDNGYSVSLVAGSPMLLNVVCEGEDCLTYLTFIGDADNPAGADAFARIEECDWVEINLHDPQGFDKLLGQLAEHFGKDNLYGRDQMQVLEE